MNVTSVSSFTKAVTDLYKNLPLQSANDHMHTIRAIVIGRRKQQVVYVYSTYKVYRCCGDNNQQRTSRLHVTVQVYQLNIWMVYEIV